MHGGQKIAVLAAVEVVCPWCCTRQAKLTWMCLVRATQVKLADVSPRLAALSSSAIPVPAQEMAAVPVAQDALPILVGVDDRIEILGTKTRPKRLWFRGSNGTRYSFLLKVAPLHGSPTTPTLVVCT